MQILERPKHRSSTCFEGQATEEKQNRYLVHDCALEGTKVVPMDKSSQCSSMRITCGTTQHGMKKDPRGALVDRGANGSIAGNDVRILRKLQREVDVTGIDNHELNSLRIVDAAAKTQSQHGEIIIIIHQCAYHRRGQTIISAGQVEHYKNKMDARLFPIWNLKDGIRSTVPVKNW